MLVFVDSASAPCALPTDSSVHFIRPSPDDRRHTLAWNSGGDGVFGCVGLTLASARECANCCDRRVFGGLVSRWRCWLPLLSFLGQLRAYIH